MIRFKIILLALMMVHLLSFSQEKQENNTDNVVVHDTLMNFLFEAHKKANLTNNNISGYRVHIYTDSGIRSKLRTDSVKTEFDEEYPEIRAYITYEEPNYRIRVGDFRTRLDARRFLQVARKDYPAAYIVPEKINFPDFN